MDIRRLMLLFLSVYISCVVLASDDIMITRDGKMTLVCVERITPEEILFTDMKNKRKGLFKVPTNYVYMIMKEHGNNLFFDEAGNQMTKPSVKFENNDNLLFFNTGEMLVIQELSLGKDSLTYQLKDSNDQSFISVPKDIVFMIKCDDGSTTLYNNSYQERQRKIQDEQQKSNVNPAAEAISYTPSQHASTLAQVASHSKSDTDVLISSTNEPVFHPTPELPPSAIEAAVFQKNPYTLHRKGTIAEYCFQYKGKQTQLYGGPTYMQQIVQDERVEGGLVVSYISSAFFNKKHNPAKGISAQYKELIFSTEIDTSGCFHLTHNLAEDMYITTSRQGFGVVIPGTLYVGQKLQCGTILDKTKNTFGSIQKAEMIYSNWEVVGENEIKTPAGTFQCMKLTGRIRTNSPLGKIDKSITCWIARGIGFVQYEETDYNVANDQPFVTYLNKLQIIN